MDWSPPLEDLSEEQRRAFLSSRAVGPSALRDGAAADSAAYGSSRLPPSHGGQQQHQRPSLGPPVPGSASGSYPEAQGGGGGGRGEGISGEAVSGSAGVLSLFSQHQRAMRGASPVAETKVPASGNSGAVDTDAERRRREAHAVRRSIY